MTAFWRGWFTTWCLSLAVFGIVLAGGGVAATDAPVRLILALLHSDPSITFDAPLRFSLAVLGAVSIGWAVTIYLVIRAAIDLGAQGRPLWHAITAGMVRRFVIDSTLSTVTGFGLNVLPNIMLPATYLIGLWGSGVLRGADSR